MSGDGMSRRQAGGGEPPETSPRYLIPPARPRAPGAAPARSRLALPCASSHSDREPMPERAIRASVSTWRTRPSRRSPPVAEAQLALAGEAARRADAPGAPRGPPADRCPTLQREGSSPRSAATPPGQNSIAEDAGGARSTRRASASSPSSRACAMASTVSGKRPIARRDAGEVARRRSTWAPIAAARASSAKATARISAPPGRDARLRPRRGATRRAVVSGARPRRRPAGLRRTSRSPARRESEVQAEDLPCRCRPPHRRGKRARGPRASPSASTSQGRRSRLASAGLEEAHGRRVGPVEVVDDDQERGGRRGRRRRGALSAMASGSGRARPWDPAPTRAPRSSSSRRPEAPEPARRDRRGPATTPRGRGCGGAGARTTS